MTIGDRERWDARWTGATAAQPPAILQQYGHLLPERGDALEIACGLGGGALWLAARGLQTSAWDVSTVALERVAAVAEARDLTVRTEARDVVANPPPPDSVDVLLVVRFLDRGLVPALRAAVRPGGLLLMQTFVGERIARGPRRPEWRLKPGELQTMATGFEVLVCSEGHDEEAMVVARRSPT